MSDRFQFLINGIANTGIGDFRPVFIQCLTCAKHFEPYLSTTVKQAVQHVCEARQAKFNDAPDPDGWRAVARDAFLDGRDAAAVEIICAALQLVSLDENAVRDEVAALRSFCANTKHGPNGSGRAGPCDPDCVKCEAEKRLKQLA